MGESKKSPIFLKMMYIMSIRMHVRKKLGVCLKSFRSILGASMDHVGTLFQSDKEHVVGAMSRSCYLGEVCKFIEIMLSAGLERVNVDNDNNEHQASGTIRENDVYFCYVPQKSSQLPVHTWSCLKNIFIFIPKIYGETSQDNKHLRNL